MKNRTNAFTLIELLVVIAVIGMLASIVLVSLTSVRAKARDARRISDMQQMQIAIETYYQFKESFPGWAGCPNYPTWLNWSTCQNGDWNTDANDIYGLLSSSGLLTPLPKDPLNTGDAQSGYSYMYEAMPNEPGAWYFLCANLEQTTPPAGSVAAYGHNYCLTRH